MSVFRPDKNEKGGKQSKKGLIDMSDKLVELARNLYKEAGVDPKLNLLMPAFHRLEGEKGETTYMSINLSMLISEYHSADKLYKDLNGELWVKADDILVPTKEEEQKNDAVMSGYFISAAEKYGYCETTLDIVIDEMIEDFDGTPMNDSISAFFIKPTEKIFDIDLYKRMTEEEAEGLMKEGQEVEEGN